MNEHASAAVGVAEHAEVKPAFSYATWLRGTDPAIPTELRLPEAWRIDPANATDEAIVDRCAQIVVAFLRSLRYARDPEGQHNGSPYDAFLPANRLPRAPAFGQTPAEYGRRLGERIGALRAPRFVDDPERTLRSHGDQPFRFGERELQGMRIFFRAAVGPQQKTGAGNCAECHVPPQFSDFRFHNTGATQHEYDALHGAGAFAKLPVPDLATRNAAFEQWLPPTPLHPNAAGPFLSPAVAHDPRKTDLGVWNVYGNPDLPAPQAALERLFNPTGQLAREAVLDRMIARFKTSTVRNLGHTAPYLHTGAVRSLEDVVVFYREMSELARAGALRNAPPEYFAMRLGADDVGALVAFLRTLNEELAVVTAP